MRYYSQANENDINQMRRRSLRLPHSAKRILNESIRGKLSEYKKRVYCLSPTTLEAEVLHYSERHSALDLKGPRPVSRHPSAQLNTTEAREKAGQIDVALTFFELAQDAEPTVKPILLYYACTQLCGVYTQLFFHDWKQDKRTHGLECIHVGKPENVGKTTVHLKDRGLFPRLATTCFLLTGMPSCFCELVTYSASTPDDECKKRLLETFGKVEKGRPIVKLTLEEICYFDYGFRLAQIRDRHGFYDRFNGLSTTAFLMDVITLFAAGSIARYDVLGWREILEGKSNSYRLHFDSTFERFQSFTFDRLLAMMEDYKITLEEYISYGFEHNAHFYFSPYSDVDQDRYSGRPNNYGLDSPAK